MSLLSRNVKTIGTHSGVFHCDEVLGCAMLKLLYPDAEIIRTRDQKELDKLDLVLDVGGEYNPEKLRFDHHQRTFNETFGSVTKQDKFDKVKLSSAGLIYCHYGIDILKKLSPIKEEYFLGKLFDKVYESLIQEVDGIDNGIPMFEGEPLYHITSHLGARVSRFNSKWNDQIAVDEMEGFKKAMAITLEEFLDRIDYYATAWWPARVLVLDAIKDRFNVHESGKVIELKKPCPWKTHFFELEKEMKLGDQIRFVIFPSDDSGSTWRVQAVSVTEKSYVLRTPLHQSWMGLRNEELATRSGVPDAIFAHANGFIGGAKTRDGALQMAINTMELTEKDEKERKQKFQMLETKIQLFNFKSNKILKGNIGDDEEKEERRRREEKKNKKKKKKKKKRV
ncbi:hypothetical protein WDU94_004215 [Cyamophila willieti]